MNISQLLLDAWFGNNDSILVLGDYCEENNIYFQELTNADIEESLYHNLYDHYHDGNGHGYGCHGYGYGNGNGNGNGNGYGQPISCSTGNGYTHNINIKEFYL